MQELKKLNSPKNQWSNEEMGKWNGTFSKDVVQIAKKTWTMFTIPGYKEHANQNHILIPLTAVGITIMKNTNDNKG
jgi:hypothetical protein